MLGNKWKVYCESLKHDYNNLLGAYDKLINRNYKIEMHEEDSVFEPELISKDILDFFGESIFSMTEAQIAETLNKIKSHITASEITHPMGEITSALSKYQVIHAKNCMGYIKMRDWKNALTDLYDVIDNSNKCLNEDYRLNITEYTVILSLVSYFIDILGFVKTEQ